MTREDTKRLIIIYHTQSGNTGALARAAEQAARDAAHELAEPPPSDTPQLDVRLVRALDADAGELLSADALLFATPENFGYMSGALKDFFDRTYNQTRDETPHTPYALLISAGDDGSGAAREVQRIARGYQFKLVADPVIITGEINDDALSRARELGMTLAAGLLVGIF